MKYLLTGVAVVAALAFSAPVGAQPSPSGGNAVGMPGPNPGGPGLTPYTSGPSQPTAAPAPAPSAPQYQSPPPSSSYESSATPPKHRHPRHYAGHHGKMAGRYGKGPKLTGVSADQLNQEELARLQAGNYSNPSAPPPPPGMAPPPYSGPRPSGSSGAGPR